ncbi:hypothetical protein GA0116948_114107 [Chitinophaga costaii]|uniref:Uncharacterized protein n=1 Tax=Chitinophaga costaii TaxID=1335309 RepID=A0A1C4FIM2_9BACT|nr:hypothetical protein [Chitinophaga costaii]PUZ20317.1 hypothetical protein DCM91_19310 [Chitinophaga costaii]SCC55859.1 hypothetical protein GA0116948_114107 [Chitinophaga costaii]
MTSLPFFICLICIFIAIRNAAQQKALKAALQAHGYTLIRSSNSRRKFNFEPDGTPLTSHWTGPFVHYKDVTFANRNGEAVLCLAAIVSRRALANADVYFDINLETLQPS